MEILNWILLIFGGLIALLLVVALFVSKDYHIVKDIVVKRQKQQVYDYIKYLKHQSNYSKWNMTDPDSLREYKGTDGTVGFFTSWDSKNTSVGKGEQSIAALVEGERVDFDLHFIKPFEGKAKSYMVLSAMPGDACNVSRAFESRMPYPMNVMRLFMNMEKMMGDDLQVSLGNLKAILEGASNWLFLIFYYLLFITVVRNRIKN